MSRKRRENLPCATRKERYHECRSALVMTAPLAGCLTNSVPGLAGPQWVCHRTELQQDGREGQWKKRLSFERSVCYWRGQQSCRVLHRSWLDTGRHVRPFCPCIADTQGTHYLGVDYSTWVIRQYIVSISKQLCGWQENTTFGFQYNHVLSREQTIPNLICRTRAFTK